MEYIKFSARNVEEAVLKAKTELGITDEQLEYEILEKGSSGILGIGGKPAMIQARKKFSLEDTAREFLENVFRSMDMEVEVFVAYDEIEKEIAIDLCGDDMGILIGKRGQTLDSLQYLVSLVVNKYTEEYVRIKLDIENYRERRKETLENLSRNIAHKVKKTRKSVELEPMNPYERRIIHSTLQNDRYVTTRSEGEEPYRRVIIQLKREKYDKNDR